DDVREVQRRADPRADVRALRLSVGLAVDGRAQSGVDPRGVASGVRGPVFGGGERSARAKLRERQGLPAAVPGPDRPGPPLLPARRSGEAAGAAGTCPGSSAHGRPRLPAHRPPSRPGLQAVRALEARSDAPGGDLLDPDGAAAEALDPGDAERGYVRGFPLFLRHL